MEKRFKDLTLADDFIFCKVMRNPNTCKHFLEAALGITTDSITYPGYIAPHPPAYAPRVVRANLIREGKVVCVAEIYLLHGAGHEINPVLRQHESTLVWELMLDQAIGNIKDIRQICITDRAPYGFGDAQNNITRALIGHPGFDMEWPQRIVLCTDYTTPNAHDDVLALLALLRGKERPDNHFASGIMSAVQNTQLAPWSGENYIQWLDEVRRYEQGKK